MANRARDWLEQARHDLDHARHATDAGDHDWARSAFTSLASSRFLDREAVLTALRQCAVRLRSAHPEVAAVHLFGSFATGSATPRSDADIVVETRSDDRDLRSRLRDAAVTEFLGASVPADVFVLSTREIASGRGVAGALAREGVRLAP